MATIFCFTSTGNSLYAARKIAEKIGGTVAPMNEEPMDCDDDAIGFVFPVYFWGLPRMVERFIARMQISNKNAYVFAVATYGGFVYGALKQVKALLAAKGVPLRYGANLKMVENYIPMYKANDSEAFRQTIDRDISAVAGAIQSRASKGTHAFAFISKISHRFYPNDRSDERFAIAPECTGCAICQQVCPPRNITMEGGKPTFHHKCEHCLACLHHCPARAIDWNGKVKDKERFRNAAVSLEELIAFNKRDNTTPI